jgi:hypothetical protein
MNGGFCMFKKNDKLDKVKTVISVLDKELKNKDLFDYIKENLIRALYSKKYFFSSTEDSCIEIIDTKDNDKFKIEFIPNIIGFEKIRTTLSCWDGRKTESKEIRFSNQKIEILEDEISFTIYSETNKISELQRKKTIRTYLNNQLAYSYYFDSSTSIDLDYQRSYASEEETFINKEKHAVQRRNKVGEKDSFGENGVYYSKTTFYDEPNFNTRESDKHLFMFGMSYATEEEFNEFLKTYFLENNLTLTNKK